MNRRRFLRLLSIAPAGVAAIPVAAPAIVQGRPSGEAEAVVRRVAEELELLATATGYEITVATRGTGRTYAGWLTDPDRTHPGVRHWTREDIDRAMRGDTRPVARRRLGPV